MDVERFRDLYRFNSWANGAVLNAVTNLAPDQWTRDLGNSFPSVRDTLVYIVGGMDLAGALEGHFAQIGIRCARISYTGDTAGGMARCAGGPE